MIDVPTKIKDYLYANWDETNPPKTGTGAVKYAVSGLGFDENACYPQILLDELPIVRSTKTYVTKNIYRIEHQILITIYVRPVNYMPTQISAAETTFRNMKTEIDEILDAGRFLVTDLNVVEGQGWVNGTVREDEPIVFQASEIIKVTYYEGS